jgi:penicillin-binding protein 1A
MPLRPASYLGAFEASLLQLTSAYTVFPNQGKLRKPQLIERVEDAAGTVLYRAASRSSTVLYSGPCALVTQCLTKVLDRGTAASARQSGFKRPAAGKTGTTDDYKDAWFVGFTSSLTAGVWVGFDKPQRTVAQGYGATMALPVWTEVMAVAPEARYPALPFKSGGEFASPAWSAGPPAKAVPVSKGEFKPNAKTASKSDSKEEAPPRAEPVVPAVPVVPAERVLKPFQP